MPRAKGRGRSGVTADQRSLPGHQAPRPSRWPLVLTIAIGLAVGAVLIERLTRPAEDLPPEAGDQPAPAEPGRVDIAHQSKGPSAEQMVGFAHPTQVPATTEGLIAEAKQIADRLAESLPEDPQALVLAGRVYYTFGSSAKAIQWWQRSLKLRPGMPEALCALGAAAWERGDFARAAALLEQGTTAEPRLLAEHAYPLADSLMNVGQAEKTVALLEQAAKTQGLSAPGLVVLGQAHLELGNHAQAQARFEQALAADPRSTAARYGLANALMGLGKTEEAQKHRQTYAQQKQQDLAAYDRLRKIEVRTDRADPAQVRRLLAGFCLAVGKVYALAGRLDQAEIHWGKAAALDPQDPQPRQLLDALHRHQAPGGEPAPPASRS